MKIKRRWLDTVLTEAEKTDVKMPWARGTRSTAWKTRLSALSAGKIKENS